MKKWVSYSWNTSIPWYRIQFLIGGIFQLSVTTNVFPSTSGTVLPSYNAYPGIKLKSILSNDIALVSTVSHGTVVQLAFVFWLIHVSMQSSTLASATNPPTFRIAMSRWKNLALCRCLTKNIWIMPTDFRWRGSWS